MIPGVAFQCMPQIVARPCAPVACASVRPPEANVRDAPIDGRTRLTEAAATGAPDWSVTSTVTPRVALDPGAYTAPSPSTIRIFKREGASSALMQIVVARIRRTVRKVGGT